MIKICYLDENNVQQERDATAEEIAEIESRKSFIDKDLINEPVLKEIEKLDIKRIRPLSEGDATYLKKLNDKIADLRTKLVK